MWICSNKAFLSVVDKANDPDCLVVRARVRGHIEALFPGASVKRTPGNDYLFRAEIPRETVAEALFAEVMSITYPNFKGSTANKRLHDAYMRVWHAMAALQELPPYETRKRQEPFDFAGQA